MIPDRFKDTKYEDVPNEIRTLFEKMPETKRGIYIHGSVGTGKTHLCYAIKKKYDDPQGRFWAKFWNTTELLREMRLDFDRNGMDKKHVEEELMDRKYLLILDDVGAEKMSDWVAETFYLIVNKRYNEMLPTIFTSNLSIADLAERIGDRTVSRIVEMCDVVELIGKDRRITNTKSLKINL